MDPREPPPQLHQHQHQHQQPNIMMGPTSYHTNAMIPPNAAAAAAARFSFNPLSSSQSQSESQSQLQPKQPLDSLPHGGVFDGSPSLRTGGGSFSIDPAKKKRGRPRKYTPDGNIALRLATTAQSPGSLADSGGGGGGAAGSASEPSAKRHRGRPPGSGKKQLDALGGVGGVGFTPHVITVKAGEDISSKIFAFSQQGPRTVCILSASGAICNVTLRQPTMSGGTVTYEGRFEIISLSGSFLLSDNNGNRSRSGGLSVSLAGSDGRVLGGLVAGMLMAASPVQVIVGSFIAEGKKSNSNFLKSGPSSAPTPHMLSFGAPMTTSSPPSQGASSESSDDNGSSPLNRGAGLYNNAAQQPIHNMHMYQLWAGQTSQ
ncbi:at-hook motif nuclear-localized protein [Citrus sinensis]|uniref:At-hook motif nuclear-localized protein n=3 Tax=Citrus sinensis TaxID=2711 RepID=A0ACB8L8U4_CITSI|nr:at-hook motif nuclear-localized protein [Citrus sinensis]